MSNFQAKRLLLMGILVIASLLLFNCEAEHPGEPIPNWAPDTFISVAKPGNVTTISWYGTDPDGFAEAYYYQWDGENEWTHTTDLQVTFEDVFTSVDEVRTFSVYSEDNAGLVDPTPATITLSPSNVESQTTLTSGPEFGSKTGEDVTFQFSGEDFDEGGEVTAFTEEMEKARLEAMARIKAKAMNMGANAIVGVDLETSDIGREAPIVLISATGTAVIIEPE